jgi:hypothetical protein
MQLNEDALIRELAEREEAVTRVVAIHSLLIIIGLNVIDHQISVVVVYHKFFFCINNLY